MLTLRDPEPTPELEAHSSTLLSYVSNDAKAFEITTQEQAQIAAELLNDIKRRARELDRAERHMTSSFLEGIEKIRALFRPAKHTAAEAKVLWETKIRESNRRRAEEASRALAEAQAAVQRRDAPAAQAAIQRVQPVEKLQGVTVRKIWKFEVTNPASVPREYLMVNETAIRQAMRDAVAGGEEPAIPGVRFFQEEQLAATG